MAQKLQNMLKGESISNILQQIVSDFKRDYDVTPYKINDGLAMRRVNFLYINTFSKGWKSKYHGSIEELRKMLTSKKNKLRRIASR